MTPRKSTLEARLASWRRNVGDAVSLDLAPAQSRARAPACSLLVLSWNVWVGRGRLLELIERIQSGHFGASDNLPLVMLLQEAYRRDDSVPERSNGSASRDRGTRVQSKHDIVDVARRLGWNLRYVPSMRNGTDRSDRGNAILSRMPLGPAVAIELPFVVQRRVAVAAAVEIGDRQIPMVSAHLDPRGPIGYKWLGAAGRGLQMAHLLDGLHYPTAILGADLNLGRGRVERAWRLLTEAGFQFEVPSALPTWRHTFHSLPRLVIDYVLVRDRGGIIRSVKVSRVDEHPRDRGATVYGSDHHPLLARVDLHS